MARQTLENTYFVIRSGCVTKGVQRRDKVSRHHGSYKSNPVQISARAVGARIRLVVTRNNCQAGFLWTWIGKGRGREREASPPSGL